MKTNAVDTEADMVDTIDMIDFDSYFYFIYLINFYMRIIFLK